MEKLMIFNFQVKINCLVSASLAVIYIESADQSVSHPGNVSVPGSERKRLRR